MTAVNHLLIVIIKYMWVGNIENYTWQLLRNSQILLLCRKFTNEEFEVIDKKIFI